MSSGKNVLSRFFLSLFYLNMAAMVAGAAWLVSLSLVGVLSIPFIVAILSPLFLPLLAVPAGIFSHFMVAYASAGQRTKERVMLFCTFGYLVALIAAWCALLFNFVVQRVPVAAAQPGLLWAAAVSISPLLWWANNDRKNVLTMVMVLAAQAGIIALCVALLATPFLVTFWRVFFLIGGTVTAVTAGRMFYEEKFMRKPDNAHS